MKHFFHSLSFKIAIKFSGVLSLMVLIVVVIFTMVADNNANRRQQTELNRTTKMIAEGIKREGVNNRFLDPPYDDIPYYMHFTVYYTDAQKIIATNAPSIPLLPITEEPQKYISKDTDTESLSILYHSITIKTKEDTKITIQVAIDVSQNSHTRILWAIPLTIAQFVFPIFIITFLIALFIAQNTLKPVADITSSAQRISTTNLDILLPQSGNKDELDTLALTFNQLFAKIKQDFDRERQFTSNVSHELKTPIAVILGQANLLRRWGKDDKEQLEKSLSSIIKESHSMESIITNLLQISRIESGKITPLKEDIDVNNMLLRIKDETEAISAQANVIVNIDSDFKLNTDQELLHQVLTVICSNSLKFCETNPVITLSAYQKDNQQILTVEDNGPGFADKDIDHVFERFYKGDDSHNRNKGGSGLGLSIAKVIMQSLKGDILVSNVKDNENNTLGAKITLLFTE